MIGKIKKMIQGLKTSDNEDCCNPSTGLNSKKSSCSPNISEKSSNCPSCQSKGFNVPLKTVQFHIKNPWKQNLKDQKYFYCNSESCDSLYYGEDGTSIDKKIKRESVTSDTICYCFGVSKGDLEIGENKGEIKSWVIEQTKTKNCACEINNPSGKCCLGNFPK